MFLVRRKVNACLPYTKYNAKSAKGAPGMLFITVGGPHVGAKSVRGKR